MYKALEEFIAPFGTIVWSSRPWNFLGREHLTLGVLMVFASPKHIRVHVSTSLLAYGSHLGHFGTLKWSSRPKNFLGRELTSSLCFLIILWSKHVMVFSSKAWRDIGHTLALIKEFTLQVFLGGKLPNLGVLIRFLCY